jgi:hypothetical protein
MLAEQQKTCRRLALALAPMLAEQQKTSSRLALAFAPMLAEHQKTLEELAQLVAGAAAGDIESPGVAVDHQSISAAAVGRFAQPTDQAVAEVLAALIALTVVSLMVAAWFSDANRLRESPESTSLMDVLQTGEWIAGWTATSWYAVRRALFLLCQDDDQ